MSDEELMHALAQGDLDKAALLFERWHLRLFNFLHRLGQDPALAQDLTQNLFVRLLRYRVSYRAGAAFKPWVYQLARHVFYDHCQRQVRAPEHRLQPRHAHVAEPGTAPNDDWHQTPDGGWHQGPAAQQEAREAQLRAALERLPPDDRELLVMSRFEELKYEEIAEATGLSLANVKVRIHRAIKKLREVYFQLEA
jgi:RNA polymerase sigma factor (sigma-70 family)